jgi:hypothetical protein
VEDFEEVRKKGGGTTKINGRERKWGGRSREREREKSYIQRNTFAILT